jgi:hypothetical protein
VTAEADIGRIRWEQPEPSIVKIERMKTITVTWIGLLPENPLKVYRVKAPFGLEELKFNSHHINIPSNTWSTKYGLITCMSAQIRSNLRDESIKPN